MGEGTTTRRIGQGRPSKYGKYRPLCGIARKAHIDRHGQDSQTDHAPTYAGTLDGQARSTRAVYGSWFDCVHVAVCTVLHFSSLTFPSSTRVRMCSCSLPPCPSTLSARPHVLPSDTANPLTRSRPSCPYCILLLDTNPIPFMKICRTLDCPVQISLIRILRPFTALLQDGGKSALQALQGLTRAFLWLWRALSFDGGRFCNFAGYGRRSCIFYHW